MGERVVPLLHEGLMGILCGSGGGVFLTKLTLCVARVRGADVDSIRAPCSEALGEQDVHELRRGVHSHDRSI